MLTSGMPGEDKDRARARAARRLLRRLESRMRLEQLAASPAPASQEQRELERLKHYYLPMWAEWCQLTTLSRGVPSEVPFAEYMKGVSSAADQAKRVSPA